MLFAYFGPEAMLPLASVLATIVGAVLMFGRASFRFALAPIQWMIKKGRRPTAVSALRGPTAWRRGKVNEPVESNSPAHESAEEVW